VTPPASARVLVVLAGGPHTCARLKHAARLLSDAPPDVLFLSGREFLAEANDAARELCAQCPRATAVLDDAPNTVESCRRIREYLHMRAATECVVVTSNYHAPRVSWLLSPGLAPGLRLRVETSGDLGGRDLLADRTARKLIRGEIVSWLYCFPLGLLWRLRRPGPRVPGP
jgi:hypothetical protein